MRSRQKLTRCGSTSAVDDEVRAGGEGPGKAGAITRCKSGPGKALVSRLEASVAAAGRPLDAVPGRRGYEVGMRAGIGGRDHAHDGMGATQKSLGFLCDSEF
jgi:hypothetical protein